MSAKQPEKSIPRSDWVFLGLNLLLMISFHIGLTRDGVNIIPWAALCTGVVGFSSWAAWRRIRRSKP